MLEFSHNAQIRKAYDKIIESQNRPQREYAFHCTNVNPKSIVKNGFHASPLNGLTLDNQFKNLYSKYLPSNPCFISKEPWSADTKYILKIDITGLPKYPDFGSLLDTGAYYEEIEDDDVLFYWEDNDLNIPNDDIPPSLLHFLTDGRSEDDRGLLNSKEFDGDLSYELIGSCCINGDMVTPDRIEVVNGDFDVHESLNESSMNDGDEKDWKRIHAHNRKVAEKKAKILTPAEFADCMEFDGSHNAVMLKGSALSKILSEASSTRYGISQCDVLCHPTNDLTGLFVDITIYPSRDWDESPKKSLESYFSECAPWIAAHKIKDIVDQQVMFLRYELHDETIMNKVRKMRGEDSERTDYEQMTFDFMN